jgi:hypothetical protein
MKYPLTFYTDTRLVPEHAAAAARLCFIFIRPKFREDEGLYHHELLHVKQWFVVSVVSALILGMVSLSLLPLSIAVFGIMYSKWSHFRLMCEVSAYKKQSKYYTDPKQRLQKFAGFISDHYGLHVSKISIEKKLNNYKSIRDWFKS